MAQSFCFRRIVKSGLTTVPDFSGFATHTQDHNRNMYEIDLTSNRIKRIKRKAFSGVRTWLLRLENNLLEELEDFAFNGSKIFNLDFQNNLDLHSLGEHAFSGISDLQSLNLSKTRIWHLPTDGLINIKELNVEDTPSLKQFPSVLKFSKIDVARLTYPHHCCAFQHPEKQNPTEYNVYREKQQQRQVGLPTGQRGGRSRRDSSLGTFGDIVDPHGTDQPQMGFGSLTDGSHMAAQGSNPVDGGFLDFGTQAPPTTHPQPVTHHGLHPGCFGSFEGHGTTGHPAVHGVGNTVNIHIVLSVSPQGHPAVHGVGNTVNIHIVLSVSPQGHPAVHGVGNTVNIHIVLSVSPQGHPAVHGVGNTVNIHIVLSVSPQGHPAVHGVGNTVNIHIVLSVSPQGHPAVHGVGNTVNIHIVLSVSPQGHPAVHGVGSASEKGVWDKGPVNETHFVHACANFTPRKDYASVFCTPAPNAFNPCEDVMGKMTVPKFLMCNLSFADLLMGLYLLLLASIDVHSLGEYFTHAVSWQNDGGCQVAGFLTVFSSELSVFVLMVITLERWYAISYAIHLTKRLRIRQAWGLMLMGWVYASTMALLPLVGVSGYGAVSMCLPMEAKDIWDKLYIVAILLLNGLAFVVICGCYISMFMKVRSSDTMARSNDATIAKRMSILVLTNFVCWAPIAFFGLTASFGFPMIDISNSKILLVFFYPLNSCANPFLYVILTKQFRKDVFILLGRYGLCTQKANQYKGTLTHKSATNSRHNGLLLQHAQHMSDMSMLSHVSTKSSRFSFNGATPKMTPQTTPQSTPIGSPRQSPLRRLMGVAASALVSQASADSGGAWVAGAAGDVTVGGKGGGKERKLSVVPETSQVSDDGSGSHEERVLEARDSLRDLFDGKPHGRVRSASEYVVLYPAKDKESRDMSREGRRRSSRFLFDKQPSLDTSISSATETSYISDSSWTRLDSFGSGHSQGQGQDSEWPGSARAVAVAAARRATADSMAVEQHPLSPTVSNPRMRARFYTPRARMASDGESPTRPLPHAQLIRLMRSRSVSQEDNFSSGTDEDNLDEEWKVKQSLL
ncbi:hypothetical protein BaRGS_00029303 [Batillaria attramentaria]|uniref:G-protein coupled receptors family 1 profile domain-containing protein n=1 Tax=Batillaria attramentaria TaxID=370345 RepID=A0ABD0JWX3_9CAEN